MDQPPYAPSTLQRRSITGAWTGKDGEDDFDYVTQLVNFAMKKKRQLVFFRNHYHEFYYSQEQKVKEKINSILFLIVYAERIPSKFFKYLKGTDGLYEIRVEFESNLYRIFCCFDEGNLVILFNGFIKKSRKTPRKEINRALKLKDEYFKEKLQYGKNEE